MLPVITEEIRQRLMQAAVGNPDQWKRQMIHRLKEENPEVNTLLLEVAQASSDPKNVIYAGYLVYQALTFAQEEEAKESLNFGEDWAESLGDLLDS